MGRMCEARRPMRPCASCVVATPYSPNAATAAGSGRAISRTAMLMIFPEEAWRKWDQYSQPWLRAAIWRRGGGAGWCDLGVPRCPQSPGGSEIFFIFFFRKENKKGKKESSEPPGD